MDIMKRLNEDFAVAFLSPGRVKGLCPVCKTVQPLYVQSEGDVSGPYYIKPHNRDGVECDGSRSYVRNTDD